MKISSVNKVLAYVLLLCVSIVCAQRTSLQPECAAWDQMIRTITKNVRAIPTASAHCTRSPDCTRFACKFLMLRKDIIFDIKIFPCTTPAQMRLLVLSNTDNVYFEQTVMNGNTYPIPGLTYNIFPGMRLQMSVKVHFQKLPTGLEIGLRLKLTGPTPLITFSYPIFPDFVIPTRGCGAAVLPIQRHCTKMNRTISGLASPSHHVCEMTEDCGGMQCAGQLYNPRASPQWQFIGYNISLVMDGCDSPLSYTVVISTGGANNYWQYKFFRSKDVSVDLQLPVPGFLHLRLAMEPDLNLETMITSMTLQACFFRLPCTDIHLLSQNAIPIPPCLSLQPTADLPTVSSTPQQDACQVWANVELELVQSAGPGYGITSCRTIEGCSGYNCVGEFEGHNYTIITVLKHCRDPVALEMRVQSVSDRFYWQRIVTHNDNITVEGTSGMLGFHIHLMKLSPSQVLVGVFAQVGLPGLSPLSVPLIQDQIMPVSQCAGITNGIPGPGTRALGPGGGLGGGGGVGGGGGKGQPQGPRQGRTTKSPLQNIKMRTGASVGIGLSIGVGIAALVATAMIYIYYRRFPSQDRVILVHQAPAPPTTVRTL